MKFKEFSDFWLENVIFPERKRKTYSAYRSLLKSHIWRILGDIELKNISLEKVIILRNFLLNQDYSPKTVNEVGTLLKNILNFGVKIGKISINPLLTLGNLEIPQKAIGVWTQSQCIRFMHQADAQYKELYIIALNTGLRLGELLALTPSCLDFNNGLIKIAKTRTNFGLNSPKNGKTRFVPMNEKVKTALRTASNFLDPSQFLWDCSPAHFTHQIFKPAQRAISDLPIITFHDLRHTFASHFMMNGGNIFDLSRILGHSDPKLTANVYAHLSPKHLSTLTDRVNL